MLALLWSLSGCMNSSTTLVGAGRNPLPDLAPVDPGTTPVEARTANTASAAASATPSAESSAPSAQPTTTTLSRTHWPLTAIYQPRGQVSTSIFGGPEPEWAVDRVPDANPPAQPIRFR